MSMQEKTAALPTMRMSAGLNFSFLQKWRMQRQLKTVTGRIQYKFLMLQVFLLIQIIILLKLIYILQCWKKNGLFPGGKNPEDFKLPEKSRTYRILSLNEKLGIKNSEVIKNSLLPDISLFTEISASGTGYNLAEERTRSLSFGISVADFGERRNRKAQLETAEIDIKKIKLENSISRKDLDIRLLNYSEDIKNMIRLAEIYERKTVLAEKILKEEQKKYRIGKTDLSSLIDAINTLDLNRRKRLDYETELNILAAGWLNLTDSLITENRERPSGFSPSF